MNDEEQCSEFEVVEPLSHFVGWKLLEVAGKAAYLLYWQRRPDDMFTDAVETA